MIFEGNPQVMKILTEKKSLMEAGLPHAHIKPLLIIDGGLMKGAYSVGAVMALEELGYSDVFSNIVGISSGAPTAAYFVAKEVEKGTGIFWQECSSRKFINMWRVWNQVNTFYFSAVLRGVSGKGLTTQNVLESKTALHIGVADFKTGAPKLLYPQTGEDLLKAIQASILMPNVSNDIVKFDDIRYVDGGFTRPHILRTAIDSIEATHVLIMTNQDKVVSTIPWLERFFNQTIFRLRMPPALRFAAHERRRERMKALEYMSANFAKPYALVWGDHSISSMERDARVVRAVTEKSRQWWKMQLTNKQ